MSQGFLSDEFKGILFGWKKKPVPEFKSASGWSGALTPPWDDAWPDNTEERWPCDFCNKMKPVNVECDTPSCEYRRQSMLPHDQGPFKIELDEIESERIRTRINENAARVLQNIVDEHDAVTQANDIPYKQGTQDYIALLDAMRDLHIRKNTGYSGHSTDTWYNFRACERWGGDSLEGIMHRMTDKWSRLESLTMNEANDQVGETMCDTLMDLAAYSLIMVCLRQERGLK